MNLTDSDLTTLSQLAVQAALQAGKIIAGFHHSSVEVMSKQAGSSIASQVVTEVDHLSQKAILDILLPSCETYSLALLTEESPDDGQRLIKDFFWCIDPMDGTLSFIKGKPGYAVSIALVARSGTPYISVIFDPLKNILYQAVKGSGVFINQKCWQQSSKPINQPFHLIIDPVLQKNDFYNQSYSELRRLVQLQGYSDLQFNASGGAVLNACWTLESQHAAFFKLPKPQQGGGCLWDYAATSLLFEETNLHVSDMTGHALALNSAETTYFNHCGVLFSTNKAFATTLIELYKAYQQKLSPKQF